MIRTFPISMIFLCSSSLAEEATPVWAKKSLVRQGDVLSVVCIGEGLAVDIARLHAINSCKATAAEQMKGDFQVKSLTIESNKEAAFHQEIFSNLIVKGLMCDPDQERIEQDRDAYKVWLRCRFNLQNANVSSSSDTSEKEQIRQRNDPKIPAIEVTDRGSAQKGAFVQSTSRRITITTIPACDDILIRGKRPRSVRCESNPIDVMVGSDDSEIILRSKGYKPKIINLGGDEDNVQIIFD